MVGAVGQVCRGLKPAGRHPPPGFGVDTDYDGDEDHENYEGGGNEYYCWD